MSNNGSRTGECACRFALEREVKESIVDAFNMLPMHREEIVVALTALREGDLKRIDALISASEEAERRMEEQLTAIEEAGGDIALLDTQIAEEHSKRDALLLERAGHANREVHLRLLMELISLLDSDALASAQGAVSAGSVNEGSGRVVVKRVDREEDACYDVEEFFNLTQPKYPEGVIEEGRVARFDNEMAIRHLDRVVVNDQDYEVRFKGGISYYFASKQ